MNIVWAGSEVDVIDGLPHTKAIRLWYKISKLFKFALVNGVRRIFARYSDGNVLSDVKFSLSYKETRSRR